MAALGGVKPGPGAQGRVVFACLTSHARLVAAPQAESARPRPPSYSAGSRFRAGTMARIASRPLRSPVRS